PDRQDEVSPHRVLPEAEQPVGWVVKLHLGVTLAGTRLRSGQGDEGTAVIQENRLGWAAPVRRGVGTSRGGPLSRIWIPDLSDVVVSHQKHPAVAESHRDALVTRRRGE